MLRPRPCHPAGVSPHAAAVLEAPVALLVGPAGAYDAEALAGMLDAQGRWQQCVWLRSATGDAATLVEQLTDACRHRWATTANGAPPTLAAAIAQGPRGAAIVVELRRRVTPGVARVFAELHPVLAAHGLTALVVAAHRSDTVLLGTTATVSPAAGLSAGTPPPPALAGRARDRLRQLTRGRPALARDIGQAATVWPPPSIAAAVAGARARRALTDAVTAALVAEATADQRAALELCVATGYWYPEAVVGDLRAVDLRPWVIPLEQQWGWLRPVWRRALTRHLKATRRRPTPPAPARPERHTERADGAAIVHLEARMLGTFELRVDGVAVPAAPGHRGYAVLRFLLSRRGHAAARDEILEQFWPDVDEKVARNRLQVAVSGVRRDLRQITDAPVIEYRDGAYGVARTVAVTVDVDRFEQAITTARAVEDAGRPPDAIASYRAAARAYRGDFASDTPYEQWSLLPRERLRLRYLDVLDRLARLQWDAGHVDECIATAHRLLDVDPSREDAHRLLMRCYAAQGRVHQALRQFDLCARALLVTVEAEPSPATRQLRRAVLAGTAPPSALRRADHGRSPA